MIDWDDFTSPRVAAMRTGYTASHVRKLADCGFISAKKVNGRWIIYVPSLVAWQTRFVQRDA